MGTNAAMWPCAVLVDRAGCGFEASSDPSRFLGENFGGATIAPKKKIKRGSLFLRAVSAEKKKPIAENDRHSCCGNLTQRSGRWEQREVLRVSVRKYFAVEYVNQARGRASIIPYIYSACYVEMIRTNIKKR